MKITKNRDLSHRKFEEKGKIISITKDKKDLSQITKFIDLVKSHKIVMEGSRN